MRIYVLCEDTTHLPYASEHGFSMLIENRNFKILFDTGMTGIFMENARRMKVDLNDVNHVVISHGHNDHVGGLEGFLRKIKGEKNLHVWLGEGVFMEKYSEERFAGVKIDISVYKRKVKFEYIKDGEIAEIEKNVFVWGPAPMKNDFESIPKRFKVMRGSIKVQDEFNDERNITLKTDRGLIVLTGCAHRGIVNIVEHAINIFGHRVYMVMGGFHLIDSNDERISKTVELFNRKYKIEKLVPCHCTGNRAVKIFEERFEGELIRCHPGAIIDL